MRGFSAQSIYLSVLGSGWGGDCGVCAQSEGLESCGAWHRTGTERVTAEPLTSCGFALHGAVGDASGRAAGSAAAPEVHLDAGESRSC